MRKCLVVILIMFTSCKIQQIHQPYMSEQVKKEELKKDQQIGLMISGIGILFFLILFY